MVLNLSPQLESAIGEEASRRGISPEAVAIDALTERFLPKRPDIVPQDEWERELLDLAVDRSVSLSNEALSREHMYD